MDATSHNYHFDLGTVLKSPKASYKLTENLGWGAWGETYSAEVTAMYAESTAFKIGSTVVLKTPAIDPTRGIQEKITRMAETYATLMREFMGQDRLKDLSCVAATLDVGLCNVKLGGPGLEMPALFVTQRSVAGRCLRQYMTNTGGITGARSYLDWCRMLACALLQVHQKLVVHGDIWPDNIMIDESDASRPRLVLIDFGLAAFRELTAGNAASATERSHPYLAPEGGGTVSSDIYAIGGVFYYLATGEDPPLELRATQDIDQLKNLIANGVPKSISTENCGVLDVIARCLRYDPRVRIPHAEGVLQDIETFLYAETSDESLAELPRPCNDCKISSSLSAPASTRLDEMLSAMAEKSLFKRMAQLRLRRLLRDVEDMANGVYDLVGDHEEIVAALSQYLSVLGKHDRYLTVSLPSFWRSYNLGVNGRFLAMNRLVAQGGATVHRVFLVTREELDHDDEVPRILEAHASVMREVPWQPVTQGSSTGGYHAAMRIVDIAERERLIRAGWHFGLLEKGNSHILLFPQYRSDGILSAMQFRAAIDHKDYEKFVLDLFASAVSLR